MKKRIIIAATFTARLGLCAAVWTQAETVGETPALSQTPAVSAPEPIVAETKLEIGLLPRLHHNLHVFIRHMLYQQYFLLRKPAYRQRTDKTQNACLSVCQ